MASKKDARESFVIAPLFGVVPRYPILIYYYAYFKASIERPIFVGRPSFLTQSELTRKTFLSSKFSVLVWANFSAYFNCLL